MPSLVIPGTKLDIKDCEFDSVRKAIGGKILIKHIPSYPPVDCTQADDCYEMAEYVVLMVTAEQKDDMLCTLCPKHLHALLKLQELNIPMTQVH